MNSSVQKVREIEGLTLICPTPGSVALAARSRGSAFFNRVWAVMRARTQRPADFTSAVEWSSLGL